MSNRPVRNVLADSFTRTQRGIEKWRARRRPREPMPEGLWREAAELARKHGINKIAKALRLDYYSLKKHVATAQDSRDKTPEFIEVIQGAASIARPECAIEIEDGGGAKLRISLRGTQLPDLAALVSAFRPACRDLSACGRRPPAQAGATQGLHRGGAGKEAVK